MTAQYTGPERRREPDYRAEIHEIYQRMTRIETQLMERCEHHRSTLSEMSKRLSGLEAEELKRKGGLAILGMLLSVSGILGGLVVKFWPFGGAKL